jgi:hypothetical protein
VHQLDLQVVQRIDVGKAVPDRALQGGVAGQPVALAGDLRQGLAGQVPFGLDSGKHFLAQAHVFHQAGIA